MGGALSFDGNDFVQVGADALAAGDGWTAALWVKRTAATASSALFAPRQPKPAGNAALKLEQYNNTQKVGVTRFKVADDVFDYSTPLDTWTHLAFVGTASETKLYADGVHQGTLNFGMALPLHRIGGYAVDGAQGSDNINAVLDDIRIYAKALNAAEVAQLHQSNAMPGVIPRLREWSGGADGTVTVLGEGSRIVVALADAAEYRNAESVSAPLLSSRTLLQVAETVRRDLAAVTGLNLAVVQAAAPRDGDVFLDLGASVDEGLGEEGYVLDAGDAVTIRANTAMGVFWGSRSLLQILAQATDNKSVPRGTARDWPSQDIRMIMLDMGRKYFEMDYLLDSFRLMSWYKLNVFNMHFSESEGFRLNDPVKYPGAGGSGHVVHQSRRRPAGGARGRVLRRHHAGVRFPGPRHGDLGSLRHRLRPRREPVHERAHAQPPDRELCFRYDVVGGGGEGQGDRRALHGVVRQPVCAHGRRRDAPTAGELCPGEKPHQQHRWPLQLRGLAGGVHQRHERHGQGPRQADGDLQRLREHGRD